MADQTMRWVESFQELSSAFSPGSQGKFRITCDQERAETQSVLANLRQVFQTDTVRRINQIQLVAESRDQGFANNPSAGNWTWLELVILKDDTAYSPRVEQGVELVWISHNNRFLMQGYGWAEGKSFGEQTSSAGAWERHWRPSMRPICKLAKAIFSLTSDQKLVSSTISSPGTEGILIEDMQVDRNPPPPYAEIVSRVENIQDFFNQVNTSIESGFKPDLPHGLYHAELLSTGSDRPLRVLALDGGGVRGLSSLHILNAVMKKVSPSKKPCEVFDMIGGTSTGGYIAIMLGRLRMSVEECIATYEDFMVKIFNKATWTKGLDYVWNGEFYDESILEDLIKELVKAKTGDTEMKLLEDTSPACKVFVMAVCQQAGNNRAPFFLRSYQSRQEKALLPDIKIWQAARATSAAPAYFKPITVGEYTLVDGGLGANNPLGWLWNELLAVFGPARKTSCFLSIGTGTPANQAILAPRRLGSHDVEAAFASAACNTEMTHLLFRSLIDTFAPPPLLRKYWRLSIAEAAPAWDEEKRTWSFRHYTEHHIDDYKDVGALDDVAALKTLMEMTQRYLVAQGLDVDACAQALMATSSALGSASLSMPAINYRRTM